ncbi:GNAT family N-acetyltransferase [Streptomyces capparidis]
MVRPRRRDPSRSRSPGPPGRAGRRRGGARMGAVITTEPLRPEDRAAWEELARGYKAFYRTPVPDELYEETWRRLPAGGELHGLGAWLDGRLVGIAHHLFHATFWMADSCYPQDLFVDESARGRGAARALIERVAREARSRGAARLYWTTKEDNASARALYDKVARHNGFIRYDLPLEGSA